MIHYKVRDLQKRGVGGVIMNWNYEDFKKAVFELTNINLSYYKERQMKRRIDSLINRNNCQGYYEYYQALL